MNRLPLLTIRTDIDHHDPQAINVFILETLTIPLHGLRLLLVDKIGPLQAIQIGHWSPEANGKRIKSELSFALMLACCADVRVCPRQSHIFDGITISKETAAFQLCDIVDPTLKGMIDDANDLRDACHVRGTAVATFFCPF